MPNLLNLFSLLIGLAGLIASAYFYSRSRRVRDPIFVLASSRIQILSSEQVAGVPIKVLKKDDTEVHSDLTGVRFYFWNQGTSSIKNDNVLETIYVKLDDPTAEIIDAKFLKISREITKLTLTPSIDDPKTALILTFNILESGDGATGQIIYEGNPNATFKISGVIEGVNHIKTDADVSPVRILFFASKESWGIIAMMISMIGMAIFFELWIETFRPEFGFSLMVNIARYAVPLFAIIYAGAACRLLWRASKNVAKNPAQLAPDNVLPEQHKAEW